MIFREKSKIFKVFIITAAVVVFSLLAALLTILIRGTGFSGKYVIDRVVMDGETIQKDEFRDYGIQGVYSSDYLEFKSTGMVMGGIGLGTGVTQYKIDGDIITIMNEGRNYSLTLNGDEIFWTVESGLGGNSLFDTLYYPESTTYIFKKQPEE